MVGCGNVTLHLIDKHSLALMENRSTEVALWLCDPLGGSQARSNPALWRKRIIDELGQKDDSALSR
jgi:hypothetical protein